MNAVYDCISDGKVGVFESPTGTGKSLSLICSTLTWLREEQRRAFALEVDVQGDEDEPVWIVEQARRQRTEKLVQQRLELESRLTAIQEKELRQKDYGPGNPAKKRVKASQEGGLLEYGNEDLFLPEDYNSDDETEEPAAPVDRRGAISVATTELMQRLGEPTRLTKEDADTEPPDELKVFFCSRTHSQLSQFVSELRKVQLPSAPWVELETGTSSMGGQRQQAVKHLPLSSRKNLCINTRVATAGSTTAINERCLELQKSSISHEKKCTFLPKRENQALVNDFRDHTLAKIRDIEDLGALGKRMGICPYYSTRASIRPSEIVTLPYQLLLLKSAREALGISLKGHIVVIDEAHNLMDAISSMHSITVSQSQLHRCQSQLRIYLQKFRNKLRGKNRVYVTQIVRLIDSVIQCVAKMASANHSKESLVGVSDLMSGKGVDQINLYKLVRYLNDSKLARKVDGYSEFAAENGREVSDSGTTSTPVLTHVQGFLGTLMNPAAEGRFFLERDESNAVGLRYLLLDPTFHFKEVVEEARTVILAGGTMSPMDDYAKHLFAYVPAERLKTWSCGHIIPKENLFVRGVSRSSNGTELDFSFTKRESLPTVEALGRCILEMAAIIPDGLVLFFPSYAYLDHVANRWQEAHSNSVNVWTRLERLKPIFRESKSSSSVEDTLQQYAKMIDEGRGGIILSVVGGKLSEGINFSDRLGRGVAVVGLPFPNIQSAQWKAKLEYIERSAVDGGGTSAEGKAAGREFYENACMRAVNQSIGRAIRHQSDFASILLLDRRYSTPRISDKLPGWIKQGLPPSNAASAFPDIVQQLHSFFQPKL
ncbi:MAG: hypothetical protein Q9207_000372 [Kuettlingeria erythrocarpa]